MSAPYDNAAECRRQAAKCRLRGDRAVAAFLDGLADEIEGLRARVRALTALQAVDIGTEEVVNDVAALQRARDMLDAAEVPTEGRMTWPSADKVNGHG